MGSHGSGIMGARRLTMEVLTPGAADLYPGVVDAIRWAATTTATSRHGTNSDVQSQCAG
jgi:hypothetical protein